MNGYWFDWRKQSARRAALKRKRDREQDEQQQTIRDAWLAAATLIGLLLALLIGLSFEERSVNNAGTDAGTAQDCASTQIAAHNQSGLTLADFTDMTALERQIGQLCAAKYDWPIGNAHVSQSFDRPVTPWAPGHRGVDLVANQGDAIAAPREGTISFAGRVGGKDVVSIRHSGGVTSTFEPAITDLVVGTAVSAGDLFGAVQGDSDHCADSCLHWGLKRGADDYLDPEAAIVQYKIVLKE